MVCTRSMERTTNFSRFLKHECSELVGSFVAQLGSLVQLDITILY
jgi:hypothetical protein